MKTVQVSDETHARLVERKLAVGAATLDEVIASLLGTAKRRQRFVERKQAVAVICRAHGVRRLRIFGSAARDEDGPDSDLDLIVDFQPDARPGLFGLAQLGNDLEAILDTRIDITTAAGLHAKLRRAVLAEAQEVWAA